MNIQDKIAFLQGSIKVPLRVSFEVFPLKTKEGNDELKKVIRGFERYDPEFISVTYGAGGGTKAFTEEIVKFVRQISTIPVAAHLTCVNTSKSKIREIVQEYMDLGVINIVALRGDMPGFEGKYEPHPEGYAYASDLVKGLMGIADFNISVAAYPEKHPEAESLEADIDNLRRKEEAGASRAITQYCFDTEKIINFIEKARAKSVTIPIVPGIIAINDFKQVVSFSERCSTNVPLWLKQMFAEVDGDERQQRLLSTYVAAKQIGELADYGIDRFHIYTLNKFEVPSRICDVVGVASNDCVA